MLALVAVVVVAVVVMVVSVVVVVVAVVVVRVVAISSKIITAPSISSHSLLPFTVSASCFVPLFSARRVILQISPGCTDGLTVKVTYEKMPSGQYRSSVSPPTLSPAQNRPFSWFTAGV